MSTVAYLLACLTAIASVCGKLLTMLLAKLLVIAAKHSRHPKHGCFGAL